MIESITEIYASVSATIEPAITAISHGLHKSMAFLSAYGTHLGCVFEEMSFFFPLSYLFDLFSADGLIKTCKTYWDFQI